MRQDDPALLDQFKRKPRCEYCKKRVRTGLCPHHIFTRGQESCTRLDIRINLIALCWDCHQSFHWGRIDRDDLLAIVSRRECCPVSVIEQIIHELRRRPGR